MDSGMRELGQRAGSVCVLFMLCVSVSVLCVSLCAAYLGARMHSWPLQRFTHLLLTVTLALGHAWGRDLSWRMRLL